jgi:hypothetical protein
MNKEQSKKVEKKKLERRQGMAHNPTKTLGLATDSNRWIPAFYLAQM